MSKTNLLLDKNEFSTLDELSENKSSPEKIWFNLEGYVNSEIRDFLAICNSLGFSGKQSSQALTTAIRDSLSQHKSPASITPTSPRPVMPGIFSSPNSDNKLESSKNPPKTAQNLIFN